MEKLEVKNPYKNDPKIREELQKALNSLRDDPCVYNKIKELGLTQSEVKNGLAVLIDYQDDFHACHPCPGLASCPKSRKGYQMDIVRERGTLHGLFSPCWLKTQEDEKKARFIRRDFPEEWLGRSFDDVDLSKSTRNRLLLAMSDILEEESSQWLYVCGERRVGKSYMLAVFAQGIANIAPGVAYLDTKEIFDELKYQCVKEHAKFERNLALLQNCPLVVLDRFGEEYKSDYVYENILKPLIRYREENDLLTAFGSRYSLWDIFLQYERRVQNIESLRETFQKIERKIEGEFNTTGAVRY